MNNYLAGRGLFQQLGDIIGEHLGLRDGVAVRLAAIRIDAVPVGLISTVTANVASKVGSLLCRLSHEMRLLYQQSILSKVEDFYSEIEKSPFL